MYYVTHTYSTLPSYFSPISSFIQAKTRVIVKKFIDPCEGKDRWGNACKTRMEKVEEMQDLNAEWSKRIVELQVIKPL
jgi:hypothetical protein